jgi:hypothetical protein
MSPTGDEKNHILELEYSLCIADSLAIDDDAGCCG